MRMTVETEQLLQDGGAPEYVYHNRTAWLCAVFVGKSYGSKGYPQRNSALYGEHCLSRQAVHNWVQKFSEGRTSIEDEHRVGRLCARGSDSNHKNFTPAGFQGLVKRWDKCLNLYGDYFEK